MEQANVNLKIPFDSLIDSVSNLSPKEKHKIWEFLNEQLEQADEEKLEAVPGVQSEIREAREAMEKGDYITIDEYLSRQKRNDQ